MGVLYYLIYFLIESIRLVTRYFKSELQLMLQEELNRISETRYKCGFNT